MQKNFETLITSYMDTQVGIVEDFLNKELALHLKTNLLNLYKQNLLYQAGTGSSATLKTNSAFRNDRIFWLDKNNKNHHEAHFFMLIENFIRYLNSSCYTGITDYEFHYTLYKPGAFYKKHIDQFKDNHQRTFSMISYLNADWQQAHGGELILHRPTCQQRINPTAGKTIFFKSNEMEHEVLPTTVPRLSVTGWLKRG